MKALHLVAANEDGGEWEIWFEAPNRWLVQNAEGFQVSDGSTVTVCSLVLARFPCA